jgi:hypothetical protein
MFRCHSILLVLLMATMVEADVIEISSVKELAEYAAKSGNTVRMKPGVYKMADYFTDEVADVAKKEQPQGPGRQPAWMIRFAGNDNKFDLTDVEIQIDTTLYPKLAKGYARCLWISGNNNTIDGLAIRNTGPQQGSNGNILSVWGSGNTISNVSLYVSGSKPYGYGDLLGKGGPNITGLQKQSGIMMAGKDNTAKRCRVISRALGHCFYIQKPPDMVTDNIRLEDCYAEGVMRSTADMLRESSGVLADLNFATIAENRDGRYLIVPGYMKTLVEDGFRTYGGTDRVQIIHCTAVNTRAGFEIAGPDEGDGKTVIDGGTALGCERAYLIGSNVIVKNSRGDTKYGPLLYLRGGKNSQVDLELTGTGSDYAVHAMATIAGEGHRVHLFTREPIDRQPPAVPIMLGFGMPPNAEMISPIKPAATKNVELINDIPRVQVVQSAEATDVKVQSTGRVITDDDAKKLPKH